jgi:hypothetical protein
MSEFLPQINGCVIYVFVVVFVPALWNLIFFFTAEGAENAEEERKTIGNFKGVWGMRF